jgi:hypothetical protein
MTSDMSRHLFQAGPHLFDEGPLRLFLFLRAPGVPCPDSEEPDHVHLVDLVKSPTGLHQAIVGGIDVIGQRQGFGVISVFGVSSVSCAAFVGNSDNTSVAWVCTAMSANAMSCISRSTG